jgi:hypothetical protein
MMPALFVRKANDADAHPQSMASGDLTITPCRVGSFRAGRHGDHDAQTSHVLDCSGCADGFVDPVAHTDGIYDPGANSVGNFEGIDT